MPNESLISTLQETRREIVQERNARIDRLDQAQGFLEDARLNLQRAQEQERVAVQADESIKIKQNELRDYMNGLIDKPQALHEKLNRLGEEQLFTYRESQKVGEISRHRQRELTDAQTRYAVAQEDMKRSDRDVAEIDSKLRELQHG